MRACCKDACVRAHLRACGNTDELLRLIRISLPSNYCNCNNAHTIHANTPTSHQHTHRQTNRQTHTVPEPLLDGV